MKKSFLCLLILCFCLVLAACANPNIDTSNDVENVNSMPALTNYENQELGIAFQYPAEWGEVVENKYKDTALLTLKFKKNDEINNLIDFSSSKDIEEDMDFRSCDDILKNGYNSGDRIPLSCETFNIDGQNVTVSYFKQDRYSSSDVKQAQIMTKKGVWFMSLYDMNGDSHFMNILNSMMFLK
ncbi:MAG: hypothetical protein ACOZBH_04005 [Patescibacteria group bacterium]